MDGVVILTRCDFHFIRDDEYLWQDPSNNISILAYKFSKSCIFSRRNDASSRLDDTSEISLDFQDTRKHTFH